MGFIYRFSKKLTTMVAFAITVSSAIASAQPNNNLYLCDGSANLGHGLETLHTGSRIIEGAAAVSIGSLANQSISLEQKGDRIFMVMHIGDKRSQAEASMGSWVGFSEEGPDGYFQISCSTYHDVKLVPK